MGVISMEGFVYKNYDGIGLAELMKKKEENQRKYSQKQLKPLRSIIRH
jgi:hypothetical protein